MNYIKHYHDNVRRAVKAITIYSPEELDLELSTITYSIIDTLTDHNADVIIYKVLNDYMNLVDNDDVDPDTYDKLFDYYYRAIYNRLEYLLNKRGYVRDGDYDIMTEDLYNKEVYCYED